MPGPAELAARLALATLASLLLVHVAGDALVGALLPLIRIVIGLDGHFSLRELELVPGGASSMVRIHFDLERTIAVGTRVFRPPFEGRLETGTSVANVLQPHALGLAMALAWPFVRASELALRVLVVTLLLLVVTALDTPFSALAFVWSSFLGDGREARSSLLLAYQQFLMGGGRFVLGIAAGAGAIAVARHRAVYAGLTRGSIPSPR